MRKQLLASGTCGAQGGNLTWTLTSDGVLTISGVGAMADYRDFSDVPWYAVPWYAYREHIRTAVLADDVTSIGNCAFANCRKLTSVHISDGVTSIGNDAFSDCTGLTSVVMPDCITSIGLCAFSGCRKLTSVTIPDGVTSIGRWAFAQCSGLTEIRVKAVVPPAMGMEPFYDVDESIPVYVPAESIEAYQNSKWGEFFSNIQPM